MVTTLISETLAAAEVFIVGDFRQFDAENTAANGSGVGSNNDLGFGTSTSFSNYSYHPTPLQTMNDGIIGLIFNTSLKVTIQGSANLNATAANREGYVSYVTRIPEGL